MSGDSTQYDQAGLNVQLTGDRASNNAQALPGYEPDTQLDPTWPGLGGSQQIRLRPAEVDQVSKWLHDQVQAVQDLPNWLASATAVSFGPTTWLEAKNLGDASKTVSDAVKLHLTRAIGNMVQAKGSIDSANKKYGNTEDANTATIRNTDAALGESGGGGVW